MGRILLVQPGAGAPDLLTLQAWRALTTAPVFAAPDDDLAERLREEGIEVQVLEEAALTDAPPDGEIKGRNLLGHQHGHIPEGARALAQRLAELATKQPAISFIVRDLAVTKAVMERALEDGLEVEFVIGRAPMGHSLLELVKIMARLRGPGGCPWDAEQTHASLAKYLLDETHEVLEAIDRGDPAHLAEELGDILLQVVFHAQLGVDEATFDIDDIATTLIDKLVRRHPHVFGDVEVSGAQEVVTNWDTIKAQEKERESVTDGIPDSLPALALAQKLQRRAGSIGFDWSDVAGALAKVREEAEELAVASDAAQREDELGDLLFSLVALGRHLDIDAETALRRSAHRFRGRLRAVEEQARTSGVALADMDTDAIVAMWERAKSEDR
jgi:MazG family protein